MSGRRTSDQLRYTDVGIVSTSGDDSVSGGLLAAVRSTFDVRNELGRPLLPLHYFANVLDLGDGRGLAISTDGVGTKILIAQALETYDTIGIDLIAMNVNDIICVGAEPIALTDYIAVQVAEPALLAEIGVGLLAGARQAGITIPGGEIAQVPEMVRGIRDQRAFDLVGTCVGVVPTDRIVIGQDIQAGDVVIGLASSGIHSNGLTLARRVLLDRAGLQVTDHVSALGRSVGEELLVPTAIYVAFAMACLRADLPVKAFIHITSDGFLNLTRVAAPVGYVIDDLLDAPPIFDLLQHHGHIGDEEMFQVFNMGVGFCAVVAPDAADRVIRLAQEAGHVARVIGQAISDPDRTVRIVPRRLLGSGSSFHRY